MSRSHNSNKTHRCFIGISIPKSLRSQLLNSTQHLHSLPCFKYFKWVRQQNFHITLNFLGNLTYQEIYNLQATLSNQRIISEPIPITVSSLSGFPFYPQKPNTPINTKIYAAIIKNHTSLDRLQQCLMQQLLALELTVENRPYRPHITLARAKNKLIRGDKSSVDELPKISFLEKFSVSNYTLFESIPEDSAPFYHPLGVYS